MNLRGIRARLLASFFLIIATFFVVGAVFIGIYIALIDQYRTIINTMVSEYRLTEASAGLVNTYNELIKSINDPGEQAQYASYHSEIASLFGQLDAAITTQTSQVAYLGVKNTINKLVGDLDTGIADAKMGDITDAANYYNDALNENYFVTQNTATLVLDELQHTEQVQATISQEELYGEVFGIILLVLLGIVAGLYSLFFSRRLVAPLAALTGLAKKIAEGDLDLNVGNDLLGQQNEVGSLAASFDTMLRSLRTNIRALDAEKKGVEEKVRQRTREFQEERARLFASINSLPMGFLFIDRTGNVVISNKMIRGRFPAPAPTLSALAAFFSPAIDLKEFQAAADARRSYEIAETKLGGQYFRIMTTPVILSGENAPDESIGSVMLFNDITQEKLLEQSKDAFLAIAAHEMRTPLTIIRGNAELMLDDPALAQGSDLRAQIGSILSSSIRLLGIVNDFLDVQTLEGGKVKLAMAPVDVVEVLGAVTKDLGLLAEKKGISIKVDAAPGAGLPPLPLDRSRLQQIYTNIISNAIHYTDKGGITITVARTKEKIEVLFADTGIGISPEEQAKLFKKFETGKVFLKSKEYGSGLGLYISRFLARLMGGDLDLKESAVGVGTVFRLTFPILAASAPAPVPTVPIPQGPGKTV